MTKIISILCSILVFALCVYLCYFKTDFGLSNEYMMVSGAPYWLGSLLFCAIMPLMTYFGLEDHLNKEM